MFRSFIALFILATVGGCTRTPPDYEEQVRQALVQIEEAVEARSVSRDEDARPKRGEVPDRRALAARVLLGERYALEAAVDFWTKAGDAAEKASKE